MTASQVHQALNIVLRDPSIHVLLAATTGASIIGLITMRCFPVLHIGGYQVSIEELVVAPEHRGQGIGSWLLEYAFGYSRQKNVVRLEVHSNITRESARRGFYIKNGFEAVESRIYRIHFP